MNNVKYILTGEILRRSRILHLEVHCSKALVSSSDLSIEVCGARLKVIKDNNRIVQQKNFRLVCYVPEVKKCAFSGI